MKIFEQMTTTESLFDVHFGRLPKLPLINTQCLISKYKTESNVICFHRETR